MRNVLIILVLLIILSSCQAISNSDRLIILTQAERYYNIPEFMEKFYNTNDTLFKDKMNLEIDSLFASPLKERWQKWIDEGSLGSCYYSSFTKERENQKIYKDTIKIISQNTIQYIAEMKNHYEYDSEYDSISFLQFKDQNITNTTYDELLRKVDDFIENLIPFTLMISTIEQEKLNFVKAKNSYLITSIETECLEMEVDIIPGAN